MIENIDLINLPKPGQFLYKLLFIIQLAKSCTISRLLIFVLNLIYLIVFLSSINALNVYCALYSVGLWMIKEN